MTDLAENLHPVPLALLGTCFTWGMTALGAAVVFTRKTLSRKMLDTMLGFAVWWCWMLPSARRD
jgi:zinc transporter, ZIP family